jgi:hypothetical protein
VALAPGQKWNPDEKIRFGKSRENVKRPGTVWVLNASGIPEPRQIVLGITDGSFTEIISGDLKEREGVIIGDSTAPTPTTAPPAARFGPFGPR